LKFRRNAVVYGGVPKTGPLENSPEEIGLKFRRNAVVYVAPPTISRRS